MQWIDSHCHLGFRGMKEEEEDILTRARAAGVSPLVNVESASTLASNEEAVAVADRHSDVFTVIGTHPHDAKDFSDELLASIRALSVHPKVVAYGEAGLDYHYDNSPREVQQLVFRKWIRAGKEDELPLVIHTRDAEADTLAILREEGVEPGQAVIHCFTGSLPFAEACVDMGLYISIPGIVTFKNADEVRQVAQWVPKELLLIETDSPFLTPVPHRGKRNEPAFVPHTAEFVAKLRSTTLDELSRTTRENTYRFFRKMEVL